MRAAEPFFLPRTSNYLVEEPLSGCSRHEVQVDGMRSVSAVFDNQLPTSVPRIRWRIASFVDSSADRTCFDVK